MNKKPEKNKEETQKEDKVIKTKVKKKVKYI